MSLAQGFPDSGSRIARTQAAGVARAVSVTAPNFLGREEGLHFGRVPPYLGGAGVESRWDGGGGGEQDDFLGQAPVSLAMDSPAVKEVRKS